MLNKQYAIIIGKTFEYSEMNATLLQHAHFIVVLDSAIHYFLQHPHIPNKPDVLLGDFDYSIDEPRLALQYPALKIVHTPDQNATDFEKGIQYIIEKGYKNIIGLGLTGKRMDHTFNNISSLGKFNDAAYIQLIDAYSKIECISRSYNRTHKKGTVISLLPLGETNGIITKNLVYPLMNESLSLGKRTGSSNEVKEDGEVIITISKGKLIIMECWD